MHSLIVNLRIRNGPNGEFDNMNINLYDVFIIKK